MAWQNAKKDIRRKMLASLWPVMPEDAKILEFGAFASPTFDRDEADIRYADRRSTEVLRGSGASAKSQAVVEVDYVVEDDFDRKIDSRFDLIIANHVIEHVPDVIGWMNKLGRLLYPGGRVFLAVPDKNYTFDIMRDPTLTRELIENFTLGRTQPSAVSVLDAAFHRRDIESGGIVWDGKAQDVIRRPPKVDAPGLLASAQARIAEGEYIDAHCNVFTEASFRSVFLTLKQMGIGDLQLTGTRPVLRPYNEFYAMFGLR